jgi:hypothetical protein
MSTIQTNAIVDASGGNTATVNGVTPNTHSVRGRNLIINGAMNVDQRNNGSAISSLVQYTTYTVDRWNYYGDQASKFSFQQNQGSVTPPVGFRNYAGITSLSAFTPGANETFSLSQYIEGQNITSLAWGTSDAKTVTLSFWVRSSLTGTFSGTLTGGQKYIFNYTISAANTWERKTITITGSTSGTWASNNTSGIRVYFTLGYGSSQTGTSGVWAATGAGIATSGSVNVVSNNAATWQITGAKLEVGSVATEFDHRSYGEELALCQRYYEIIGNWASTSQFYAFPIFKSRSASIGIPVHFRVQKRAIPTITSYDRLGTTTGVFTQISNGTNLAIQFGPSSDVNGVYRTQHATQPVAVTESAYGLKITVDAEL